MSQVESQAVTRDAVSYKIIETPSANKIAALWMQNPPVNALSKSVRVGLIEHLNAAIADESVEVIVNKTCSLAELISANFQEAI